MGLFGGKSDTKVAPQTASDSGQNIGNKGKAIQGGATNLEKGASQGLINLAGAKLDKGATLSFTTNGVDEDTLTNLLGSVSSATADQIAAFAGSNSQQLKTITESTEKQFDKVKDLLTTSQDTQAGSPKAVLLIALGVLATIAAGFYFFFRRH